MSSAHIPPNELQQHPLPGVPHFDVPLTPIQEPNPSFFRREFGSVSRLLVKGYIVVSGIAAYNSFDAIDTANSGYLFTISGISVATIGGAVIFDNLLYE